MDTSPIPGARPSCSLQTHPECTKLVINEGATSTPLLCYEVYGGGGGAGAQVGNVRDGVIGSTGAGAGGGGERDVEDDYIPTVLHPKSPHTVPIQELLERDKRRKEASHKSDTPPTPHRPPTTPQKDIPSIIIYSLGTKDIFLLLFMLWRSFGV